MAGLGMPSLWTNDSGIFSPDGAVRGFRHIMLDDSDIGSTRHARAAVGGIIAGVTGCGAVYVSGGADHQGPAGDGPIAVIARA
jgi:cyanuric acid amidohydrolase